MIIRKLFLTLLTAAVVAIPARAQNTALSSAEILQNLQKLKTIGSVLYVAAHPDDENTRLLAYLSKERKIRTGYVSITRGDGGQNLVGKEQGELLGLVRTQELLAARGVDGAQQFFTRANDFGYSKNQEETFGFWNKDSVLSDLVWIIRQFKPDVIICRFPTTGEGGHGHHTASAILAEEAFDAAADPKKFPEQLKFTSTWQAKRIFWNTFSFGSVNTTSEDQLKIDVGVYNPLLGKGYGEIAAESRSMHKSQGFGSSRSRGSITEYFKLLKGDAVQQDLFDGVELSWKRFTSTADLDGLMEQCIKKFNPRQPDKSIPDLVALYKKMNETKSGDVQSQYWKKIKMAELQQIIIACAGLWAESYAADYRASPGMKMMVTTQVVSRNAVPVKLVQINTAGIFDTLYNKMLGVNDMFTDKHTIAVPEKTPYSNPYWLNENHAVGSYKVNNRLLIGKPENDPAMITRVTIELSGQQFTLDCPVVHKSTDPVKGEVYRPLEILPPATVNFSDKVLVFGSDKPRSVQLTLKANSANVKGKIIMHAASGWTVSLSQSEFTFEKAGDEILVNATVSPGKTGTEGMLSATLEINGKTYDKSIQRVDYDHIPSQFVLSKAEVRAVHVNLEVTGTRIGYIPGAGDDVAACLQQIGYTVTTLTDDMLMNDDLNQYNAIVTGVRAYNTNERMSVYYTRLMEYIKQGGNMLVQYNTNSRFGPLNAKMGPYAFTISRTRVTDENAEVVFTRPQHPVLNVPNKISNDDFKNWIQERGIYFATDADSIYTSVFTMHDPGEEPATGSLLVAPYGKGNFVYTGLAFFRELPAGVPGAYRLFVNLLSLPQHKD